MLRLFHAFFLLLAKATDREVARMVEFLRAVNRILRSKLPKVVRVTPGERRRLVSLGKKLGLAIKDLISIVTPRTFARWLKAGEKAATKRPARPGRPRTPEEVRDLVLNLARETGWGYTRIVGELKKLGLRIVARLLHLFATTTADQVLQRGQGGRRRRASQAARAERLVWATS
jgi:putative transposase